MLHDVSTFVIMTYILSTLYINKIDKYYQDFIIFTRLMPLCLINVSHPRLTLLLPVGRRQGGEAGEG